MLQDMVTHLTRGSDILALPLGLDGARKERWGGSRPEIRVTRERVRQIQNLAPAETPKNDRKT